MLDEVALEEEVVVVVVVEAPRSANTAPRYSTRGASTSVSKDARTTSCSPLSWESPKPSGLRYVLTEGDISEINRNAKFETRCLSNSN